MMVINKVKKNSHSAAKISFQIISVILHVREIRRLVFLHIIFQLIAAPVVRGKKSFALSFMYQMLNQALHYISVIDLCLNDKKAANVQMPHLKRGLMSELEAIKKLTYQIDLLSVEVLRQEGRPGENFIAFVLWDLVKLGANQQQRHWVLCKLLSVIVTVGRKEYD